MGELSLFRVDQRLVGPRRSDEQSLRAESKPLRLQLRFRRHRFSEFCCRLLWQRDRCQHRLSLKRQRVAAIKPTVGLVSRAGVVPISHTQDTVGPHGRTVADCAAALGVIQSRSFDGSDPATGGVPLGWSGFRARHYNISNYMTQLLTPKGLKVVKISNSR